MIGPDIRKAQIVIRLFDNPFFLDDLPDSNPIISVSQFCTKVSERADFSTALGRESHKPGTLMRIINEIRLRKHIVRLLNK